MRKILAILFIVIAQFVNACHDAGVNELSATDNSDGTYTYTFEVCVGELENTWGFELTLNYLGGTGNLISYTNSITSTNTGVEIFASVPSTSGTGDIEYGDFDNTANPVWSDGTTNECPVIEITVDTPLESVVMFGHQFGTTNCTNTTTTTSDCFSNTADYTVELTTPNCTGANVTWNIEDPEGDIVGSGSLAQNGASDSWSVCGCGVQLNLTVPIGTIGPGGSRCTSDMAPDGQIEVFDGYGNSLGTASESGETIALDCLNMPIELYDFSVTENNENNVIKWVTLSETDNNYFTLEKSQDGVNWVTIQIVNGAGNSNYIIKYEVLDYRPNSVINYYRLTQYDYNGEREIFPPISIDNRAGEIIKTVNLLGREVGPNYRGVVIEIYTNKTIKSFR